MNRGNSRTVVPPADGTGDDSIGNLRRRRLTPEQQSLAARHVMIARALAKSLQKSWPSFRDEFESTAMLALVQAAHTFDPLRNVKFSTFARIRIKGALLDTLRDVIKSTVQTMLAVAPHDSVLMLDNMRKGRIIWMVADPPVGHELVSTEYVENWLKKLPPRHAAACRLIYIEGMTQHKAASVFRCSTSRMSYLKTQSMAMLKESWERKAQAATKDIEWNQELIL